jgi:S-adenosylmethionine decarboxylase proenzyme
MNGLHLTADVSGCATATTLMRDPAALRAAALGAVAAVGLSAVGDLFHQFARAQAGAEAAGVTGVVLLAESHLTVHTWPELASATLDVYVCNLTADNSLRAQALMEALVAQFGPSQVESHRLERGRRALGLRHGEAPPLSPALP